MVSLNSASGPGDPQSFRLGRTEDFLVYSGHPSRPVHFHVPRSLQFSDTSCWYPHQLDVLFHTHTTPPTALPCAQIPTLLRGQLLVSMTSASGTPLDATGLQVQGALDALFYSDAPLGDAGCKISGMPEQQPSTSAAVQPDMSACPAGATRSGGK